MSEMISNVNIIVSDKIFIKNPESSDLGRKIISGSIDLIDEIGFECFTFRKLAQKIESTEASVYRYFENKQRLLLYLSCWYWSWMEYRLVLELRPDYKYPHMLISAVIEDAHQQRFFAEHLPRLTDKVQGEDSIVEFHKDLVFKTLELNNN